MDSSALPFLSHYGLEGHSVSVPHFTHPSLFSSFSSQIRKKHHSKIHLKKTISTWKLCCEAIKRQTKIFFLFFSVFLFFHQLSSLRLKSTLRPYIKNTFTRKNYKQNRKKTFVRPFLPPSINQNFSMWHTKRSQVQAVEVSLKFNTFLVPIFRSQKRERSRRVQEIELSQ